MALGALGGLLYIVALVVEVGCAAGRCAPAGLRRDFALDGLWGLPRLFTTAVFVIVAVVTCLAWRRIAGWVGWWWALVAGISVALAVAKAISVHSSVEQDDGRLLTLTVGVALTAIGLPLLGWAGQRWSVAGALPVCAALAAYAVAALGLDQMTGVVSSSSASPVLLTFAVFLEEGGEAVTALVLLATVVHGTRLGGALSRRDSSGRCAPAGR